MTVGANVGLLAGSLGLSLLLSATTEARDFAPPFSVHEATIALQAEASFEELQLLADSSLPVPSEQQRLEKLRDLLRARSVAGPHTASADVPSQASESEADLIAVTESQLLETLAMLHEGVAARFAAALLRYALVLDWSGTQSDFTHDLVLALPVLRGELLYFLSTVDDELPSAFDIAAQALTRLAAGELLSGESRDDLIDALALAELVSRDWQGYLTQPVRARIEAIPAVCLRIGLRNEYGPPQSMTPGQFAGCMADIQAWMRAAREPPLAGAGEGPFEQSNIRREFKLEPAQRIAYWLALFEQRFDCQTAADVFNPIEWLLASATARLLLERWPAYADQAAQTLAQLKADGEVLLDVRTALEQCTPSLVRQQLDSYGRTLRSLRQALRAALAGFREQRLEQGADVRLALGSTQETQYRPQGQSVSPCERADVCGVAVELTADPRLFDPFPDSFLLADQTRLLDLQVCMRSVRWAQVRRVPVNAFMASYFGHLEVVLEGRAPGMERPIWTRALRSEDEYEYLYGPLEDQLLEGGCPSQHFGQRVEGQLPEARISIVKPQITYLAAKRSDPQQLLTRQWESWQQDVFGRADTYAPSRALRRSLDQHLATLYEERNAAVYAALLQGIDSPAGELAEARAIFVASRRLLEPRLVATDDALRASLYGTEQLAGAESLERLRDLGVPAEQIAPYLSSRLKDVVVSWARAGEGGHDLVAAELAALRAGR